MLSAVILWFHLEFGWTVSLSVLFAAVFSQWLVVFGRNLWWSLGVFYLPAIALMYFLRFRGGLPGVSLRKLGALALVIVFIKCFFNGCEYITTTLAMMAVPVIYYIILDSVRLRESLKALGTVALGSCLGILLSFCVLCFQVASVKGHFSDGVAHITYSFHKRTYGDPHNFPGLPGIEQEGLTATPGSVVAMYANGTFFDASCFLAAHGIDGGNSLQIKYWHLLLAFSVVSILLYSRRIWSTSQDGRRQEIALIWATWFSILAPLSWFVIFKAHSYVHKHMNYLVWQMPFVLFGFAMCGATFRSLGSDLIRLWRRPA
jgi:hypothetical protein